ncbi:MAG TPA: SRPBCC domain-containing protein [Anaerolineae bacterium]|nr:SRPBCC domain-containing protein [Anaerolineae bacterium]
MLRIEQSYVINASPEQVWQALTDPEIMAQWSGQPAQYDARVGGNYRLWTDYVTGQVIECDPPNRLAQTWRPNDWTIENSVVSFTLTPTDNGTQFDLLHENVQPEDYDGTSEGWNEFYIGALKSMLEAENAKPKRQAVRKPTRAKKATKKLEVIRKPQRERREISAMEYIATGDKNGRRSK